MRIYRVRVRRQEQCETFFILCKQDILSLFTQGYYKEVQFIAELPDLITDLPEAEESEED
jgi:hypothetical protein